MSFAKKASRLASYLILVLPAALSAQPAAQSSPTSDDSVQKLDTLVVTGTRVAGRTVDTSPAAIDILGGDDLRSANQSTLLDSLNSLLPSFNVPNVQTPDIPSMIRAGELRDLPADATLVLVNGKRRHQSAFLQTGGYFAGEAPVDLSLIPQSSIASIQVLRDGASAIYGSDAIAGVINLITKDANSGGEASVRLGQYFDGGGETYSGSWNQGLKLGSTGYANITFEADDRTQVVRNFSVPSNYLLYFPINSKGQEVAAGSNYSLPAGDTLNPKEATRDNYAWKNVGSPGYKLALASVDFGAAISHNIDFYGFGTYSYRTSSSAQNFRQEARLEDVLSIFPDGFTPYEAIKENDAELTAGFKGRELFGSWDWDLSGTVARDQVKIYTENSVNPTYRNLTPTNFYDGADIFSSGSTNLDLHRAFEVASLPIDISAGGEVRLERFQIENGDLASWSYGGLDPAKVTSLVYPADGPFSLTGADPKIIPLSDAGAQALPGIRPSDVVDSHRTEYAYFVGASIKPLPAWAVDVAGRFENYSDAGSTWTGRFSTRYDFSPVFALRGTISNGFHAPTLAVDTYQNTANINTYQQHTLAVDSSLAKAIGAKPLVPETSRNYSVGIVSKPAKDLSIALDAYQINLSNLIAASSSIRDTDAAGKPTPAGQAADALVTADGFASGDGLSFFLNAANTRTRGAELTIEQTVRTGGFGKFLFTLAGSLNRTEITANVAPVPPSLAQYGISLFNAASASSITYPGPRQKVVAAVNWNLNRWSVNLRQTWYGKIDRFGTPTTVQTTGPYAGQTTIAEPIKPLWVTDLGIDYRLASKWTVSLDFDNLFNVYPTKVPQPLLAVSQTGAYPNFGPVGALGGFYSLSFRYKY